MSNVLWYQSAEPLFTDCGSREWAKAVGRNYIGSASAFWAGHEGEAAGNYYYKRGHADRIDVNHTRWFWTMDAISSVRDRVRKRAPHDAVESRTNTTNPPSWIANLWAGRWMSAVR